MTIEIERESLMSDMKKAITNLANSMTADYALWQNRLIDQPSQAIKDEMLERYENTLDFQEGRKYIRVVTDRSCSGFIVNTDNDPKFKRGDLLKAASWKSPTRNFARGNIFNNDDVLQVRWTGIQ